MSRPGPLRLALFFVCACVDARCAEPAKQFQLVQEHIEAIRRELGRKGCRVFVYVERNLGFEAGESLFISTKPLIAHGLQAHRAG